MADDERNPQLEHLKKRLMAETGITEVQARDLILLLGTDWPSLVREAKTLKARGW